MSQQLADNQTMMTEDQVKRLIKNLANAFGHPIRSPILRRPEEYGLEYEEVVFPSMDGIPLEAWFFPADSDKLVIANHPLWFNRYGFPAHLDPWKQIGAAGGNDFEVNFMPDYKHLHEAGYNVLCYDMRNFGQSGAANGGIGSNGIFEARDVIGSLQYVKGGACAT
jgi:pimeloyl-ACP methyl ester carboxylesterase